MKKIATWGGGVALSLLLALSAWGAGFTENKETMTIVVDQSFQFSKPDKSWDTKKVKKEPNMPLKLVLHQFGRNPEIQIKQQDFAGAKKPWTLGNYAENLKKEYKLQGITIEKVEKKTINGHKAVLLHGVNPYKEERYLIGAWLGKDKGYLLECSSGANDFTAMQSHFEKTIGTARLLK